MRQIIERFKKASGTRVQEYDDKQVGQLQQMFTFSCFGLLLRFYCVSCRRSVIVIQCDDIMWLLPADILRDDEDEKWEREAASKHATTNWGGSRHSHHEWFASARTATRNFCRSSSHKEGTIKPAPNARHSSPSLYMESTDTNIQVHSEPVAQPTAWEFA